ncbi:intraflagellar transport protein 57, partial [Haematococcus lacustris]
MEQALRVVEDHVEKVSWALVGQDWRRLEQLLPPLLMAVDAFSLTVDTNLDATLHVAACCQVIHAQPNIVNLVVIGVLGLLLCSLAAVASLVMSRSKILSTPDVCMEMLVDKLKLLDYEREKPYRRAINRQYFAQPDTGVNLAQQFFYFTSLAAWLLGLSGVDIPAPKEYLEVDEEEAYMQAGANELAAAVALAEDKQMLQSKAISTAWPDSRVVLEKLSSELDASLDKLTSRERFLNEQFERLMAQYRAARVQLTVVQLTEMKGIMDEHSTNIADATPVAAAIAMLSDDDDDL